MASVHLPGARLIGVREGGDGLGLSLRVSGRPIARQEAKESPGPLDRP